jgi:hypothetical protein
VLTTGWLAAADEYQHSPLQSFDDRFFPFVHFCLSRRTFSAFLDVGLNESSKRTLKKTVEANRGFVPSQWTDGT